MLEGFQKRPGADKILTKNRLRIFFGGSGPKKSIFGIPTWPPKSYQNPLRGVPGALPVPKGRPEPSGEPFWRHFGSILGPFRCDFGMILHAPLPPFLALLLPPPALLFFVRSPALLIFLLRFWIFLCHLWASALRSRALALRSPGLRFAVLGFSSGVFVSSSHACFRSAVLGLSFPAPGL